MGLTSLIGGVPTYGENLRRFRASLTQEKLAAKAGKKRQANLSSYENNHKFPGPKLVRRHASVLGKATGDLMLGVVTEYDRLRWPDLSDKQIETLLVGVTKMKPAERTGLLASFEPAVAAVRREASQQQAAQSILEMKTTAAKTHQRKRQA